MSNRKSSNLLAGLCLLMLFTQGCGDKGDSSQQSLRPSNSQNHGDYDSVGNWQRIPAEQQGPTTPPKNELASGPTAQQPMVALYPFFGDESENHILVKDPNELMDIAEYTRIRETIQVYADDGGGTRQALYRCFQESRVNHFTSIYEDCEGSDITTEDLYGYIEPQQTSVATRPLYRMYHPERGDHVTTFDNVNYMSGGYLFEMVLGYLPAE